MAIAQTATGRWVIKRSCGPQFPNWLAQEHRVLTELAPLGLPVPKPLYFEHSRPEPALTLATRPKPGIFLERREYDLAAFYAGYGRQPISQAEWEWCEALYNFF